MAEHREAEVEPRAEGEDRLVGAVAEVTERIAIGGRGIASFMPLHRGVPGTAEAGPDGVLRVEVDERPDVAPSPALTRELERFVRSGV